MKLHPIIELRNVEKKYKIGDGFTQILKNISLQIQPSEVVSIMGASGSGKSTLMNIIGFLDGEYQGDYLFHGRQIQNSTENELAYIRNQKIGFVFQSFFLLPRLNVLNNIMLPLLYRQINKSIAKDKAFSILKKLSIEKFFNYLPHQLSGGQQQRVAIARALVGDPELILADEPTGALDSITGNDVMKILLDLNASENKTVIIVTHDEKISRQCQRIIFLNDGEIAHR